MNEESVMSKSVRCLYNNDFKGFCSEEENSIIGSLIDNYHGDVASLQVDAWKGEIAILQSVLKDCKDENGKIIFEYDIPRLGKRIDVVLLLRGIVFCLEFKVGESNILESDVDQVFDYALDLNNFHKFSDNKVIAPILVATKHNSATTNIQKSVYSDNVLNPLVSGENGLSKVIKKVIEAYPNEKPLDPNWIISPYEPTPTIIEAARALYENHSVEDITRHEADKVDTDKTIAYILKVIASSKANREKSICFVTGVPGAGKTLVGLDVAIKQTYQGNDEKVKGESAIYLSGNGPLVAVLREALTIDNVRKAREKGTKKNKTDARREVEGFIQIIHRYRDNMLKKIKNPVENGVLEIDPDKAVKNDEAGFRIWRSRACCYF